MDDRRLTERQNQIMALIAEGKDRREVEKILKIKQSSINTHLVDIYSRYGVTGLFKISKAVVIYLKNIGRL